MKYKRDTQASGSKRLFNKPTRLRVVLVLAIRLDTPLSFRFAPPVPGWWEPAFFVNHRPSTNRKLDFSEFKFYFETS